MKVLTFFILILSFNIWLSFCEDLKEINPGQQSAISYDRNSTFYFAHHFDDSYLFSAEGVVTFKFNNETNFNVYSTIGTCDSCKKEEFLQAMPKSEKDSKYPLVNSELPNYFFLFYNSYYDGQKEGWLLITVEVNTTETTEQSFVIEMSSPANAQPIIATSFQLEFQVKEYVPKIFKYALSKREDRGFTYVFSSFSGYMTVFDDTLLLGEPSDTKYIVNPTSSNGLIYSHTLDPTTKYGSVEIITILFFGPAKTITLEMDNTESEITTISPHERPTLNVYPIEIDNAFQPYHFIGFYDDNVPDDTIFFEKVYGDGKIYYNDYISNNTKSYKEVLPDEKIGEEVINDYVFAETSVDIITIKCFTPCLFNIHFITDDQLFNTTRSIGEMFYVMITGNLSFGATIKKPIQNANIEVFDVNKKDAALEFRNNTINLLRESPIIRVNLPDDPDEDLVLKFSTSSKETVLLLVKLAEDQGYKEILDSDGNYPINGNRALFKMPKIKEYLTYHLNITKTKGGDATFNYYVGKGEADYIHFPQSPSVYPFNSITFNFNNPYYNELSIPESDEFYYIAVNIIGENLGFEANVELIKKEKLTQLVPLTTTKIEEQDTFQITQAENEEQKLFIAVTKCNDYEVDIYLKFKEIELSRHWIENQFTKLIIEPKNYNMDIEFRKGNQSEPFSPLMFYYQYATQKEIDAFTLNDDFTLSYRFRNNSNTSVFLTWKNPFSSKVESVSVKYLVFKTEYIDENSTFSICDYNEKIPIYQLTTNLDVIQEHFTLNRSIDNYIYIIAEPQTGIRPKFTYRVLEIPKSIEPTPTPTPTPQPTKESSSSNTGVWIAVTVILIVIVGLLLFLLWRKKKKANIIIEETNKYKPIVT